MDERKRMTRMTRKEKVAKQLQNIKVNNRITNKKIGILVVASYSVLILFFGYLWVDSRKPYDSTQYEMYNFVIVKAPEISNTRYSKKIKILISDYGGRELTVDGFGISYLAHLPDLLDKKQGDTLGIFLEKGVMLHKKKKDIAVYGVKDKSMTFFTPKDYYDAVYDNRHSIAAKLLYLMLVGFLGYGIWMWVKGE
jgi:hypothetical protein